MTRSDYWWILALTLLFEAITCLFRFGFGMQSTRDTIAIARYSFGIRIHHGYIGVLLLLAAPFFPNRFLRSWLIRVGAALVLSDLAHHFLVLWPITGNPEFDLIYPKAAEPKRV